MYSTGLTSLRKTPQADTSRSALQRASVLRPDKEVVNGLAVKKEVEELEKDREKVKVDINDLVGQRNRDFKQIASEISVLRRQKIRLIDEVKAISEMLFVLRGAKDKGEVNFDEFFKGREGILVNFASAVSKRIASKSKNLNTLSDSLINEENIASEMVTYATLLLEGTQNALHEVGEAKVVSEAEAKKISGDRNYLKYETERFNKLLARYWNREAVMSKTNKEVAKLKSKADTYVKETTEKVNKLLKDVKIVQKKVQAKEEFQDREQTRLSEWERGLKDKENSVRRLFTEIKGSQK